MIPKFRGDLLESAAVVEGMLDGRIESTVVPRKPLDVLAQQVVAMCAMDEWEVDELGRVVRRAYPYGDLGPRAFESVLDMLSGRYPSDEFAELRPRIVWDRIAGKVRGRAGAQRLAVTNPGTIPDRGLYSVNLLEDGRRVGELDEEMVYETRIGETFVLGASTWRIAEITPSQVLVTPAPGEPGKIAFWKADAPSRPVELGAALGKMVRELRALDPVAAATRLRQRAGFDDLAIKNLLAYLDDQASATGAVPDDRTIVVERFRDEVGDWRICLHTPFGGRVHAPLALALEARLREKLGVDARALWTDDGIAMHLPEVESPPPLEDLILDPDEVPVAGFGRAARIGPLRRPFPGERRTLSPPAQTPPRPTHTAVAAAHAKRWTASGCGPVSGLPDPGRDVARGDERPLRHAGAHGPSPRHPVAPGARGRGRHRAGFPVRLVAAVLVCRRVHV